MVVVGGGGGRPLQTTADHRGELPRTIVGPASGTYYSTNAARTPADTLVWGNRTDPGHGDRALNLNIQVR